MYVNNQIETPPPNYYRRGHGCDEDVEQKLYNPPPPHYSLKMIRNALFNPSIHLCPSVTSSCSCSQCTTCSYRYMWIWNPYFAPLLFHHPLVCMTSFFSKPYHLWNVYSAKHKYHEWNPQNICTITKSYKKGRWGGGGGGFAQVYVLSDLGDSSREILVFTFQGIKLIFFKGLGVGSNWH